MRVVILTQYYPPEIGAPQTRLAAVVDELRSQGHEVEVVTALPNYPSGHIAQAYRGRLYVREVMNGVAVHRVWLYAATGLGIRRIANYLSFAVTCVAGLVRCRRPDVVFVESPPPFLMLPGSLAARIWGARLVMNVADLWPDSVRALGAIRSRPALAIADRLEHWCYRSADQVNGVTEGIRQALHEKGVPRRKVLFFPNGVDTRVFAPRALDSRAADMLGNDGARVLLYAGTMGYAQGLDTVVGAAAMLRERKDVRFVFVGDGSDKQRLVRLTDDLALENVRFIDPVPLETVAALYSGAFASIVSLRDVQLFDGARPSKMLPAMACAVPVIYCGRGEGADLLLGARAGCVVAPEQPEALAATVVQLLEDPEMATRLGRNGRKYVEKHLAWGTIVSRWVQELSA